MASGAHARVVYVASLACALATSDTCCTVPAPRPVAPGHQVAVLSAIGMLGFVSIGTGAMVHSDALVGGGSLLATMSAY